MVDENEERDGDEPELEPDEEEEAAADDEPADDEPADDEPADDERDELIDEVEVDVSDRAIKAREKALDSESRRHERALERAWGSLWEQFHVCPLCEGDGFMVPRPAGSMPEEQFAAVYAFAGQAEPDALPPDQEYTCCDNCKGWGATAIAGSERPGLSKQCDRCLGTGYMKSTAVTVVPPPVAIPGPLPLPPPPPAPSYGATGPDDAWGRPAGHAHYGIPPANIT